MLLVGGLIEDGGCIFGVGKMELAIVGVRYSSRSLAVCASL